MHYIVFYDLADDYIERRAELREAHLQLANDFHAREELVLAGALMEPVDQAVLVFRTAEAAEAFVLADPYVANGLVKSWRLRKWNVVIGEGAAAVS